MDVLRQQIRVYTPRGDMVELAQGSTPLDFAYTIHTGLGDQCQEAYVNEASYPLNRPLRDGDYVFIQKKPVAQPLRAWLDKDLGYITTNYALSHARRWFRRLTRAEAIDQGRQLLISELVMLGLPGYPHAAIAEAFQYKDEQELYYELGRAEVLPTKVSTRVLQEVWPEEPERNLDTVVVSVSGEQFVIKNANGHKLRLCGTCQPRPLQSIVGYLRTDGGVTVHAKGCHTLKSGRTHEWARLLKLEWGQTLPRKARLLTVKVEVYDRPGLLYEITDLMRGANQYCLYPYAAAV
jgi:(p)ppGpp synthase/HD superfamily hydrolase